MSHSLGTFLFGHASRAGIDVAKDAAHREQPHASDLSLVPEAPGDDLTVGRKLV